MTDEEIFVYSPSGIPQIWLSVPILELFAGYWTWLESVDVDLGTGTVTDSSSLPLSFWGDMSVGFLSLAMWSMFIVSGCPWDEYFVVYMYTHVLLEGAIIFLLYLS